MTANMTANILSNERFTMIATIAVHNPLRSVQGTKSRRAVYKSAAIKNTPGEIPKVPISNGRRFRQALRGKIKKKKRRSTFVLRFRNVYIDCFFFQCVMNLIIKESQYKISYRINGAIVENFNIRPCVPETRLQHHEIVPTERKHVRLCSQA